MDIIRTLQNPIHIKLREVLGTIKVRVRGVGEEHHQLLHTRFVLGIGQLNRNVIPGSGGLTIRLNRQETSPVTSLRRIGSQVFVPVHQEGCFCSTLDAQTNRRPGILEDVLVDANRCTIHHIIEVDRIVGIATLHEIVLRERRTIRCLDVTFQDMINCIGTHIGVLTEEALLDNQLHLHRGFGVDCHSLLGTGSQLVEPAVLEVDFLCIVQADQSLTGKVDTVKDHDTIRGIHRDRLITNSHGLDLLLKVLRNARVGTGNGHTLGHRQFLLHNTCG